MAYLYQVTVRLVCSLKRLFRGIGIFFKVKLTVGNSEELFMSKNSMKIGRTLYLKFKFKLDLN